MCHHIHYQFHQFKRQLLGKQFRARNAEVLFFVFIVSVIIAYFAVVTAIQAKNWRFYLDTHPFAQEERTLTPEEIEIQERDARLSDYNLAAYELCADPTLGNPYGLFFPFIDWEARLAYYIGINDFDEVAAYVDNWNEYQVAQRKFRTDFDAKALEYQSQLKIMSMEEFKNSALQWWFSSVSGCPNDWRLTYDAAATPPLTLDDELLYYTAKVINIVAGSDFISLETKAKVGQVFLNRIASLDPKFPDSAAEVFAQPAQYATGKLESAQPSRLDMEAAFALLTESSSIVLPDNIIYCNIDPVGEIYEEVYIPELDVTIYFGSD